VRALLKSLFVVWDEKLRSSITHLKRKEVITFFNASGHLVKPKAGCVMFSKKEREIESVIRNFFMALDTQNLELMEAIIGRKEEMVHIGTAKGEVWRGWEELHKATVEQFKKLEYYKANIQNLRITIADSGDVAWYSHLLNARIKTEGKEHILKDARFTGVLEKTAGRWVMLQTHVSVPEG
jgi:ketosteroid isomerase-like protein